jgi:hypothetical protein
MGRRRGGSRAVVGVCTGFPAVGGTAGSVGGRIRGGS